MMYTFEYDRSFNPSFPQVKVTLANINDPDLTLDTLALIDSGADATSVPVTLLRRLNAQAIDTQFARGYIGPSHPVDIFEIGLQIQPLNMAYLKVIQDIEGGKVLLGRDVINQLSITLNGLSSTVEIPSF